MVTDHVQWMAPSPMWTAAVTSAGGDGVGPGAVRLPALLRFATDTFMEDYLAILEADPGQLSTLRATPETWRGPLPAMTPPARSPSFIRELARRKRLNGKSSSPAAGSTATSAPLVPTPLKLYQPAHQRHYLVSACLVCRVPGLPDCRIDPGRQERAGFVVRRLDPATNKEYAFVTQPSTVGWQPVANDLQLAIAKGEERFPLSGVSFIEDSGRRRRLLTGVVPVARREAYLGAGLLPASTEPPAMPDPKAARTYLLQAQVTGPWINLLERADAVNRQLSASAADPPDPDPKKTAKEVKRKSREHIQTISWYILLDFAHYLQQQTPNVWAALTGATQVSLNSFEQTLVSQLGRAGPAGSLVDALVAAEPDSQTSVYVRGDVWTSLAAALNGIGQHETTLETVTTPYDRRTGGDWPQHLLPLADPDLRYAVPISTVQGVHDLETAVIAALPDMAAGPEPAVPLVAQSLMDPAGTTQFVVRCVFERPECGPMEQSIVSEPSGPFQFAGFFDPDAPARPIRIPFPVDISPAGLRKFDKNTALMISDALCGQLTRVRDHLTLGDLVLSVLPWPFHQDLPKESVGAGAPCEGGSGQICTLSLPIITICALILLSVIVILFDIIFDWLPWFFLCFSLPGFRSKPKP